MTGSQSNTLSPLLKRERNLPQEIDDFASNLLEEAKRYIELATEEKGGNGEAPYLHAALMLGACGLEAHVNAVCDEMAKRTKDPHDLAILLEREVRLKDGKYVLENKLKIFRLEDRLNFLHVRFGIKPAPASEWRSRLAGALDLRNKLTHPKAVPVITIPAVEAALKAFIEAIDVLYRAVYKKPFPAGPLGLDSSLGFGNA